LLNVSDSAHSKTFDFIIYGHFHSRFGKNFNLTR
jgi:predicted phosphodiesterase